MQKQTIKVAYVAGTGKSGSTLLSKLLGQVEGFVDVGELINVGAQFDREERCGCGAKVRHCALWPRVLKQSIGGIDRLDRKRWSRLRSRYLPLLLIPGARRLLPRYFSQLQQVYRTLPEVAATRLIADSSKSAFYGAVLSLFPDVQVYTLHLIRDVRAAEGSMQRLKAEGVGKFAGRSTWWNSVRWMLANRLTEWAARRAGSAYLRVRYEDLVSDPGKTLAGILAFMSQDASSLGFIEGNRATLSKTHNVAGSDVRFTEGEMALRLDERWRESLPEHNRAVVDRLTRRFRRRYGY